jgi:hypothetical protein
MVKLFSDTFCFRETYIQQCCIILSDNVNDSLQKEFAKNELVGYNFINGETRQILKFKKRGRSINGDIYFFSCKDFVQKLVLDKESGDTTYLKMSLIKKGKNEDMWFHKISFTYTETKNKIYYLIFIR